MLSDLTLVQIIAANACVFLGAVVQGVAGIGLAIVAVLLLALIDTALIPVPMMMLALELSIFITLKERSDVYVRGAVSALAGYLPGAIAGGFIIWLLPHELMAIVIAVIVMVAVLISVVGFSAKPTVGNSVIAGMTAGVMGTISSVAGPVFGLLYQHESGPRVRGTINAIFVVAAVITISVNAVAGRVHLFEFLVFLSLNPGIVIGYIASRPLARYLDHGFIRPTILIISFASAVAVLIQQVG